MSNDVNQYSEKRKAFGMAWRFVDFGAGARRAEAEKSTKHGDSLLLILFS